MIPDWPHRQTFVPQMFPGLIDAFHLEGQGYSRTTIALDRGPSFVGNTKVSGPNQLKFHEPICGKRYL
jgi:hypothetical protein